MKYILDTNVISDLIIARPEATTRLEQHRRDQVYLCPPVYYESRRGLLWKQATTKIALLEQLRGKLYWQEVIDSDWTKAAQLWAQTTASGKQLSDVDLLIAALAMRLDATVVSADADFDALPVKRENWRV
jgi:predicted nucleic acid-binding protein